MNETLSKLAIRDILKKARTHFEDKEYAESLECYEYFFKHSLDDDPYSLYGVRLSYCINEWTTLGNLYAPALQSLKQQRDKSLSLFKDNGNNLHFSEFNSISKYLNEEDALVKAFLDLHHNNKELAQKAIHHIWEILVRHKQWEVCGSYPRYFARVYPNALSCLDKSLQFHKNEPDVFNLEFIENAKKSFVEQITALLSIYRSNNESEQLYETETLLRKDMQERNFNTLPNLILKTQ